MTATTAAPAELQVEQSPSTAVAIRLVCSHHAYSPAGHRSLCTSAGQWGSPSHAVQGRVCAGRPGLRKGHSGTGTPGTQPSCIANVRSPLLPTPQAPGAFLGAAWLMDSAARMQGDCALNCSATSSQLSSQTSRTLALVTYSERTSRAGRQTVTWSQI